MEEQVQETQESKEKQDTQEKGKPDLPENASMIDILYNDLDGVVPEETLKEWSNIYGPLYVTSHYNDRYIYRMLDYNEYRQIWKECKRRSTEVVKRLLNNPDITENELAEEQSDTFDSTMKEEMFKTCVLFPDNIEKAFDGTGKRVPAGIVIMIAEYISALSGFSESTIPEVYNN